VQGCDYIIILNSFHFKDNTNHNTTALHSPNSTADDEEEEEDGN
jgi:hypothetical protein